MGRLDGGECVAPRLDQGREGPKGGDRDPEVEREGKVEVERQSGVGETEKRGEIEVNTQRVRRSWAWGLRGSGA